MMDLDILGARRQASCLKKKLFGGHVEIICGTNFRVVSFNLVNKRTHVEMGYPNVMEVDGRSLW